MSRQSLFAVLICAIVVMGGAKFAHAAAPFFMGLESNSTIGISDDGSVVVGRRPSSSSSNVYEAFRWSSTTGMVGLGDLPGGEFHSLANAASVDGSVVVGSGTYGSYSADETEAFRWTQATGMIGLGDLPGSSFSSAAIGVSDDGTVIIGRGTTAAGVEAFRWTQATGMTTLGAGPGSFASDISADGSVIVGNARANVSQFSEAFRWTQATGVVRLGDLPGGDFNSQAVAVSADGSVIAGNGSWINGGLYQAFRWTQATGMVALGDLPGGVFGTSWDLASYVGDVSGDGSIIVGESTTNNGGEAFIWDTAHGMRNLREVLIDDYGLGPSLTGWRLGTATGISADGTTITGYGSGPGSGAWIAHIPEPSTLVLASIGLMAGLISLRRRR